MLNALHNIFSFLAVASAVIAAIAAVGSFITGKMIEEQKNKQIYTLEKEVKDLGGRALDSSQKEKLIATLRSYGEPQKVAFASRMMDRESAGFADQLAGTFKEAGWVVGQTNRSSLNDYPGYLNIFVTGNPPKDLPDFIQRGDILNLVEN